MMHDTSALTGRRGKGVSRPRQVTFAKWQSAKQTEETEVMESLKGMMMSAEDLKDRVETRPTRNLFNVN